MPPELIIAAPLTAPFKTLCHKVLHFIKVQKLILPSVPLWMKHSSLPVIIVLKDYDSNLTDVQSNLLLLLYCIKTSREKYEKIAALEWFSRRSRLKMISWLGHEFRRIIWWNVFRPEFLQLIHCCWEVVYRSVIRWPWSVTSQERTVQFCTSSTLPKASNRTIWSS